MRYIITNLIIVSFLLVGCKEQIGDSCTRDLDCSANGDRMCDNSQPKGYCLEITCTPDQCPSEAACVEYMTSVPAFDTDSSVETDDVVQDVLYTLLEPSRTRTYCLKRCKKDKECRDQYHCAMYDELYDEMNASIIDPGEEESGVCVPGTRDEYPISD